VEFFKIYVVYFFVALNLLSNNFVVALTLSLRGGGLFDPFFEWPVAQKVMKLQKFGKISYSMEIILALKLSSGVSLKKRFI
jgi:hypothetical protein